MTEAEWLKSSNPEAMLGFLPSSHSGRRFRLFAVACCRCVQSQIRDGVWHTAIAVAELYADRVLTFDDIRATEAVASDGLPQDSRDHVAVEVVRAQPDHLVARATLRALIKGYRVKGVRRRTAALIRDIFGNPFRPVAFSPSWRTDTAMSLARGMYGSRDFGAMPILADALQDAGCDEPAILGHCRAPGEHVRGCWVIDLVLGKE